MEKLSYEPYIPHFSYPHPLVLATDQSQPPMNSTVTVCSCCSLPCDGGHMYTCRICAVGQLHVGFALHVACAQLATVISHPSHPKHRLSLHHAPLTFNCNGCCRPLSAFCYRCPECDFDLHPTCASMPLSTAHPSHDHLLRLQFFPPYDVSGFSCDVCDGTGKSHWLYRCSSCDFDAHLDCATSTGGEPTERAPATVKKYQSQPPKMPPAQQMYQPQQPAGGQQGTNNGLPNMMAQSFLDATVRQAGQSLVTSLVNGGGNHTSGGGGSGNVDHSSNFSFVFDSVLGDDFDDGDNEG